MKRTILLNPGPVTTTDTVKKALLTQDICHREKAFTRLLTSIRSALLKVAEADDSYSTVLFASSGTGAIEACLSSLIPPGKSIAVINNGAYGQRIFDIAKRYSIPVVELRFSAEEPLPLPSIEACIKENKQISYLVMVHHETSLGILNPIQAVGEICQRQKCGFIVDAMSSFGGSDLQVTRDYIDFLISTANKCLQGMPGVAFVIGKKEKIIESKGFARSYYFDLFKQYECLESTGELPYTAPVQILYALKQALDELLKETVMNRVKRYHDNYDCLSLGLEALGFINITPKDRQSKLLMTVQHAEDRFDFDYLCDTLSKDGFVIYPSKVGPSKAFRLACMGDLNQPDIVSFLECLERAIQ